MELEDLVRELGALYLEKRMTERENAELRGVIERLHARLHELESHQCPSEPEDTDGPGKA